MMHMFGSGVRGHHLACRVYDVARVVGEANVCNTVFFAEQDLCPLSRARVVEAYRVVVAGCDQQSLRPMEVQGVDARLVVLRMHATR